MFMNAMVKISGGERWNFQFHETAAEYTMVQLYCTVAKLEFYFHIA